MKLFTACATLVSFLFLTSISYADDFGNGTIKIPTTVSGGTGTVANLQADDDVKYEATDGSTITVGGFGTFGSTINSVYLFAQYSVEPGYSGTNALQVNGTSTSIVPADRDYGRWSYVDITAGSFGINSSGEIDTMTVTFTNNDGASSDSVFFDYIYVVVNPQSAIPTPPTWSEDFNGTGAANPMVWSYEEGYQRNNELQYYVVGDSNGWMENGNFVIEGRKEAMGGYDYTSASIYTHQKYYWHYGRAQIRAKIPCLPGMWPAIWGTGEVGQWPHNGEVDIMEYYSNKILANCAVGTTQQWNAKWDSSNRSMTSLTSVDPDWKTKWHIWTMQWDDQNVRLYVDNILMNTISQSWLKNTDGYNTSWGPQYPFISNGMTCWLNLAMGGAGGDPSGTLNSGPQRYYIDYWKVWEGATSNVAPTDITLSSDTISEGLPAGTVVGTLSAADADPAEVLRYSLVAGTGDTHNSQFTIPEFVCDNTLTGVLKTNQVLSYLDGPTRSIRVRVTDIEGATYTKVFTINVTGQPEVEVSTNSISVDEGGTNTFGVKLRLQPASTVTVNVSRASGDSDISVSGGATLQFTTSDWDSYKTVTLAAAEDADRLNGTATIQCVDAGGTYGTATVTATEVENDNSPPVVDAGPDQYVQLVGGSSWSPADLSPDAWYDAADAGTITETGGVVSQWNDKSGNNRHMTQGTTTNRPGYSTTSWDGSLPALTFDGTDDYLEHSTSLTQATVTMAVVLEQVNTSRDDRAFGVRGITSGNKVNFAFACDNSLRYDGANSGAGVSASVGKHFRVATRTTSSAVDYHDGSQNINATTTLPNVSGYINAGNTMATLSGYFSSKIAEGIVIYGSILPEDRQRIEGYFAHKWGLLANLPTDHPYKSDPPGGGSVTVNLDGTVTDDDGDTPTTLWTVVSAPGSVVFGDASAVDTTATMTIVGTYILRLTAADDLSETLDEVTIYVSADPPSGPVVSVSATDGSAAEEASDTGTWTLSRTGATTSDLTVNFALSGSATLTSDYTVTSSTSVTIPTGQSSTTVILTPVDDAAVEGDESATLTISADAAYTIGTASASITITDNDSQVLETWIVAGQSNAEGYGITESPVASLAPTSTLSSIGRNDLNTTHTDVNFYQGANDYNNVANSAGMAMAPKNSWHDMTPYEGLCYDWGSGIGNESGRRFGPELSFGFEMQQQIGAPIAIIKYARGSASLAPATTQQGSGLWNDFDPSDGGRLNNYDNLLSAIQGAIDNLPANTVLNLRGICWMQGESDANATMAASYEANLTEFIGSLRSDIGTIASSSGGKLTTSATSWANLDVLVGTIDDDNADTATVIAAQNAVAAADNNVITVDGTTGLSMMTNDDWWMADIHYDTAGQVLLGERFASAATSRLSPQIIDVSLPSGISLYGYTGANPINTQTAFQALIDNNELSLVRWINASGSIKELYYSPFPTPGWINEIGNLSLGQGYVVKTTAACTLSVAGDKDTNGLTHNLPTGYSIVGFNQETPLNAQTAFQPLIDAGKLELVRWVDPSTGGIKEFYYSTFPSPGWVNEIGNLVEGQGYIIKLNAAHSGFNLP